MVPLSAKHLTKTLGRRVVVSDVSFDLEPSEVFGFLGPNGAGKTTTIRMLTGLIRPDSGSVVICGIDLSRHFEAAMRNVGAIIESPDLYRSLTGRENLEVFAEMVGSGARSQIEELSRLVRLDKRLEDRVSTYSLGMRQRLGIAQALLGEPRVLILDEPANGLDPAGIREMRELLKRLARERGLAVFVSSHLLSEVELMCDRVAILHRGRILAVERVEALLSRGSRVRFRTPMPAAAQRVLRRHSPEEPILSGNEAVRAEMPDDEIPRALTTLSAEGIPVFEVVRERPPLEEMFLELTHGETV